MVEKYIHSSYIMGAGKMPTPQQDAISYAV
jgi:hypothetical protein